MPALDYYLAPLVPPDAKQPLLQPLRLPPLPGQPSPAEATEAEKAGETDDVTDNNKPGTDESNVAVVLLGGDIQGCPKFNYSWLHET